jgi:AbrB family looped-hinge helix DNA binding protein
MSKGAQATVTSKGQVTIPQKVREDLGLSEGDRLDFVRLTDGNYAIVPAKGSIRDLEGVLKRPGRKPVSIEEMQDAIESSAAGE